VYTLAIYAHHTVSIERIQLELAGAERIDEVRGLWLELHHHHLQVVGSLPLVQDDMLSWQRRRALYLDRLGSGEGFLVIARQAQRPAGYAFVCVERGPDDTFPVGDRFAEIYSLSVAAGLRGQGIGTKLLDFVDHELASRSITDVKITVMTGNEGARRLYERRGLREAEIVLYRFAPRP
jgi:ribosomal protein S18 acetylase RimI-like enzyme